MKKIFFVRRAIKIFFTGQIVKLSALLCIKCKKNKYINLCQKSR